MRVGALVFAMLTVAGCTEDDPDYCDGQKPCDTGRVCNVAERTCYPLGTDLSMSLDGSGADLAMPKGCSDSVECAAGAPLCSDKKCGPCAASGDAGTASVCTMFHPALPFCSPGGACVECLTRDDCADPRQKTCDGKTFTCVACAQNDECSSGLCRAGACVLPRDIFYVDNRGTMTADCKLAHPMADGAAPATAFCDVGDALAAKPPRAYLLVAASKQPYGGVVLTGSTISKQSIVSATRLGAALLASSGATVSLTGQTSAIDLTLDGLRVGGSFFSSNAVECKGKPSAVNLTIVDGDISGGDETIHSANCNLVIDSTLVHGGTLGGLIIDGTDKYRITNSFIFENANGGNGQGVSLGAGATGLFAWNTVANNGGKAKVSGAVVCNGASQLLQASIIAGNAQRDSSQLNRCLLADVVTGPDNAPGADTADPRFVTCTNPLAANVGYCVAPGSRAIDLVGNGDAGSAGDGGTRDFLDRDYFGNKRPQGAGYDVGAQEQ